MYISPTDFDRQKSNNGLGRCPFGASFFVRWCSADGKATTSPTPFYVVFFFSHNWSKENLENQFTSISSRPWISASSRPVPIELPIEEVKGFLLLENGLEFE